MRLVKKYMKLPLVLEIALLRRIATLRVVQIVSKKLLDWQLSDCGFCQYHLMTKSAIT